MGPAGAVFGVLAIGCEASLITVGALARYGLAGTKHEDPGEDRGHCDQDE